MFEEGENGYYQWSIKRFQRRRRVNSSRVWEDTLLHHHQVSPSKAGVAAAAIPFLFFFLLAYSSFPAPNLLSLFLSLLSLGIQFRPSAFVTLYLFLLSWYVHVYSYLLVFQNNGNGLFLICVFSLGIDTTNTMQTIKCVVVGDGAVGKVRTLSSNVEFRPMWLIPVPLFIDVLVDIVHDQQISFRICSYGNRGEGFGLNMSIRGRWKGGWYGTGRKTHMSNVQVFDNYAVTVMIGKCVMRICKKDEGYLYTVLVTRWRAIYVGFIWYCR